MSECKVRTDGFHCVDNAVVYDLDESLIASGYPMRTTAPDGIVTDKDYKRATKLSRAANGNNHAHDQFMTGIRVSFDLHFSNKAWVESERYRFLEFVSSQSTMHRITKFDIANQCNKYVRPEVIQLLQNLVHEWYVLGSERDAAAAAGSTALVEEYNEKLKEKYLEILYNTPSGFELTARMTTNYRCLKNIYNQRKDHRLPEWREFCRWVETLPYAEYFITCEKEWPVNEA